MSMTTSDAGIRFIKSFEGFRASAYYNYAGEPWTIGYGHTRGVKEGDTCTLAEAESYLKDDLKEFEKAINSLVKVPLKQNQFDALVSFVFNIGTTAFKTSTLLNLLNEGRYQDVPSQLMRWNKVTEKINGVKHVRTVAGQTTRRKAESHLFSHAGYV